MLLIEDFEMQFQPSLFVCVTVFVIVSHMSSFGNRYALAAIVPLDSDSDSSEKIAGDVNLDGVVDQDDVDIVLSNFGTATGADWTDGDMTGDGKVDSTDLAQVLNAISNDDEDDE